jgi:3D (Asp-Asp-Asp) domain-containing protein
MLSTLLAKGALSFALAAMPMVTSTYGSTVASVSSALQPVSAPFVTTIPLSDELDEPAPTPAPVVPVKTYRVTMTAYSSTPDQTDDTPFHTANGTYVHDGIVAANFLPFHTKVRFPELFGDKVFTVEDRMNKRFSQRMDIWMESRAAALRFGLKRNVLVEVLPEDSVEIATVK